MKTYGSLKRILFFALLAFGGWGLMLLRWPLAIAQQAPREQAVSVAPYLAAHEQMQRMPHYSTAQGRFLPAPTEAAIENGVATWTELGPGNLGGRTRALVINPANPDVIYAASPGGGVWKTTNGGVRWTPLNDLLPNLVVTTLTLDPKNPEVIYAGTGERAFERSNRRGAGIFKSSNGGTSWTQLPGTKAKDFDYVNDFVISPVNSQRLYAATGNGVWRSLDGGVSWTQILKDQISEYPCEDLAIRTDQQTDYLFASYRSAIQRNPDAAGTGSWVQVYTEFGVRGIALALAPSNQNVVYALVEGGTTGGQLGAVLRSISSGDAGAWTAQVRGESATELKNYLLSDLYNVFACQRLSNAFGAVIHRGWYSRALAVDPVDPNRLWVGGVDLFRSDDGGANWGVASYWWTDKRAPQYVPADHHAIVFHPQYNGTTNQTLLVANESGIYRTTNARAATATSRTAPCNPAESSVAWATLNNSYNVTQFNHGTTAADGKSYIGGTVGSGVVRGADADGVAGWKPILSSNVGFNDGGYVAIDPTNPAVIYATLVDARASVWKSTDGGKAFGRVINGVIEPGSSPGYFARLAIDPSDQLRLWLGSYLLFRTDNGATRWNRASAGGTSFIAIAPTDSNSVMTADYRDLYITSNGLAEQADWRQTNPRYNSGSNVADPIAAAAFDPVNKRIAYIVYGILGGKHVWKTTDAGATWQAIDGTGATALPDVPVRCIAVDPNNPASIYVGTEIGVFVTLDGGANWAVETTGFGGVAVKTLTFTTAGGTTNLFAFTDGRGAWRVTTGNSGCQRTLSATRASSGAAGGSTSVNVTADCAWAVESNAAWITATGGSNGAGAARLEVAANANVTPRVGTVTIAGKSFTVYQAAAMDTKPPTISITFPATDPFTIRSAGIGLIASISDDNGEVSVTWNNDRGGTATDTIRVAPALFSFRLQPGLNRLTITARDASGNVATATRSVIFKPEYLISAYAGTGVEGFSGDGGPATAAQIKGPTQLALDRAGNLYFTDAGNFRIRKITPAGIISTLAGTGVAAQGPSGDGQPAIATPLQYLRSVLVTDNGDIYFLEGFTHLRRIAANTGLLNTIASIGIQAGDMALDGHGNFLVTGGAAHQIYKIAPAGTVTHFAGTGQISGPLGDGGPATAATLFSPFGITIDRNSNAIFADQGNHRVRQVAPNGIITTLVGDETFSGSVGDGGPARGVILYPRVVDVVTNQAGNLFIAEGERVRKVSPDGIINTIAGTGGVFYNGDGQLATSATVGELSSIALDGAGNVYLADTRNHRIRQLSPLPANDNLAPQLAITTPTANATWTTLSGRLYLGGTATDNVLVTQVRWSNDRGGSETAQGTSPTWNAVAPLQLGLNRLTVTAWDAAGNASSALLTVNYQAAAAFETAAGKPTLVPASSSAPPSIQGGFSGDGGPATQAQLDSPRAVARDAAGNLYIADTANHCIRRVTPDGKINTYAGSGIVGAHGDGGPATAAGLNEPRGLAVDAAGNLYLADTLNNRIRKVTPTGIISTVAGTGVDGLSGDGSAAVMAQLSGPQGLAVDGTGNLFIADTGNHRIRKLTVSTGVITTVAGSGFGFGFGGDNGPATAAVLRTPSGVAVDAAGNLYIADTGNLRIRKVSTAGIITTIAGNGLSGSSGDGGLATAARLTMVEGIAVDAAGNVYLADTNSHRIRRITPAGTIALFAGVGFSSITTFGSEVGDALVAQLNQPTGLTIDSTGKLYIADTGNHRVLAVTILRSTPVFTSVSAASYAGVIAARASINAAFGANLAGETLVATTVPLPTEVAGISLRVRDGAGMERLAPLFFVSPGQINFQIPPETALGQATLVVTNQSGELAAATVFITAVAPGLFSANADGQGVATGVALRIKADGSQSFEPIAQFDQTLNRFVTRPIDLGPTTDQVFLVLFGTGIRGNSSLARVNAKVGGVDALTQYAGAQGRLIGLDQLNLLLPRSLAGRGEVAVTLTVDNLSANTLRVSIK